MEFLLKYMLKNGFKMAIVQISAHSIDIAQTGFEQCHIWTSICTSIRRGVMLDLSQYSM